MKHNYIYEKGMEVYYQNELVAILSRYGNLNEPAYKIQRIDLPYFATAIVKETELSLLPVSQEIPSTKQIEYHNLPNKKEENRMENNIRKYSLYLKDFDNDNLAISKYSRNLNLLAVEDKLPPAYGREEEIEKLKIALCRRTKPNTLLIGQAGVGKTAIVEELAKSYVTDYCKNPNIDIPVIYDLSLNSLVGGSKYRGDLEQRLDDMVATLRGKNNVIVFIDEIHSINTMGATSDEGQSCSIGQILKPALARGEIKVIGATTIAEYERYIANDKALVRRFTLLKVSQLNKNNRIDCICNIIKEYGNYFNIDTSDIKAIDIDYLIENFMSETVFPNNCIDIIDNTLAAAKYFKKEKITIEDIYKTVSEMTGYLILNKSEEKI